MAHLELDHVNGLTISLLRRQRPCPLVYLMLLGSSGSSREDQFCQAVDKVLKRRVLSVFSASGDVRTRQMERRPGGREHRADYRTVIEVVILPVTVGKPEGAWALARPRDYASVFSVAWFCSASH